MNRLSPVSIVSEGISPSEGDFWCSPDWYNPLNGEPSFLLADVARFFFARSASWLRRHIWSGHLVLDGEPLVILRDPASQYQRWGLYDVERTAHALTQGGYLKVDQLQRVIGLVKLVAQNYNYLLVSPLKTRIEPVRNTRRRMAVETLSIVRDDLDDATGAAPRSFAVGEIQYEIDLTDTNWEAFLAVIGPYVAVARPSRRRRVVSPDERDRRAAIRVWAAANGYKVGDRGRIPYAVIDAYAQATQPGAVAASG